MQIKCPNCAQMFEHVAPRAKAKAADPLDVERQRTVTEYWMAGEEPPRRPKRKAAGPYAMYLVTFEDGVTMLKGSYGGVENVARIARDFRQGMELAALDPTYGTLNEKLLAKRYTHVATPLAVRYVPKSLPKTPLVVSIGPAPEDRVREWREGRAWWRQDIVAALKRETKEAFLR